MFTKLFLFILTFSLVTMAAYQPVTTVTGSVSVTNVVSVSGTISASNPSVSSTGVAVPSYATYLGLNNGGNLIGALGTGTGAMVVSATGTFPAYLFAASGTQVTARTIGNQIQSGDGGLVVNSIIHGLSSGGGGTYVDVKVNPSGSLETSGTHTINGLLPAFAATPSVSAGTVPVTGTFWQATQPVSIASTIGVSAGTVPITSSSPLTVSAGTVAITSASPLTVSAGTVAVTGTFWQATQPVSAGTVAITAANTLGVSTGTVAITAASPLSVSAGTVAITSANTLSVSAGTLSVTFPSAQSVSSVGTVQVSGTVLPNGVFTVSAGTVGITAASTLGVSAGQVTVLQGTSPWVVSATANSYTPADGMTNVFTAPQQLAYNMVWNGTTWDRMHSGGTNGEATTTTAAADARAFGFSYDGSSSWNRNRSGITSGSATVTGYQNVIPGAIYNATPPTLTTGQYGALQSNAAGALLVSSTGTIPISAASALTVSAGTVAITAASTLGVSAGTVPITASSPLSVSAGTVAITSASPLTVSAGTVAVTGTFWQATQPVSAGTVSVTFPSAQQVSAGTVAITAASTLSVSAGQITVLQGTSPWTVSGSVSLNGTQPVSSVGTVVVSATGVTWDSPVPNATSTNALTTSFNSNISKVAIKASAGRIYQVFGHSYNSGCGWIHIFNSAAQPAANTAPLQIIPLCQNQAFSFDFALPYGAYLSSGIYVGFSTSQTAWVNTTGNSATWINALYQ